MPGVTVTLKHTATNSIDDAGDRRARATYSAQGLLPGDYEVRAELAGFQAAARRRSRLQVGQRARVDFTHGAGCGDAGSRGSRAISPLLDTQSAVVGRVVSQVEVAKLPLAGRSWDDLLSIVPGVQGDRYTEETVRRRPGEGAGSTSTATARCKTTSCSTAWTTTRSPPTCRSEHPGIAPVHRRDRRIQGGDEPVHCRIRAAHPGGAISVTTKSGTNRFAARCTTIFRNDRFDAIPSSRAGGKPGRRPTTSKTSSVSTSAGPS